MVQAVDARKCVPPDLLVPAAVPKMRASRHTRVLRRPYEKQLFGYPPPTNYLIGPVASTRDNLIRGHQVRLNTLSIDNMRRTQRQ